MTVIISDTLTGASAEFSGSTPDTTNTPGNNWATKTTGLMTRGGSGVTASAANDTALIDTGITDDSIFAQVDFDKNGNDNRASLIILSDGTFQSGNNRERDSYIFNWRATQAALQTMIADASATLAITSTTIPSSGTYKIELDPVAATLKCYIDGAEVTALTQTSFTPDASLTGQSYAGIVHNAYASGGGIFSNFIVDNLAAGGGGATAPVFWHHHRTMKAA